MTTPTNNGVRLIRLRDGSTHGAPDYSLVVNGCTIASFITGIAPHPLDDNYPLVENVIDSQVIEIAQRLAEALGITLREETLDASDVHPYVANSDGGMEYSLVAIADWTNKRYEEQAVNLEDSRYEQGNLIDMEPGLGGYVPVINDEEVTPTLNQNNVIDLHNVIALPAALTSDQLHQELYAHSETFYVQPFYTHWLKNASPEFTSAQLDEAICHARSAILGLSMEFVNDTVDRLFADSNPLNLENNTLDDQLVPTSKNIKRMREQMQLDPNIFYVIALETHSLFDEMIRHGYSNTPANRNKILQDVAPTVTQLFIRCLDACSRALVEV